MPDRGLVGAMELHGRVQPQDDVQLVGLWMGGRRLRGPVVVWEHRERPMSGRESPMSTIRMDSAGQFGSLRAAVLGVAVAVLLALCAPVAEAQSPPLMACSSCTVCDPCSTPCDAGSPE